MNHQVSLTIACVLLLASIASADQLSGTVTNGTTGKPAVGVEVILLKLEGGMEAIARTRTDSNGRFTVARASADSPHLLRVMHQNVNYHRAVPPGTSAADVTIYDAAEKVPGVTATVQVMRFETEGDTLRIIELYGVRNTSAPPRTQMSEQSFEIFLPENAVIDSALAISSGGMPVNSLPSPQKEKGRYAFVFPLRPGETRFEVAYHVPYAGQFRYTPRLTAALEHFIVMLPKSMTFTADQSSVFQAMADDSANVQVATGTSSGQALAFQISGTGTLPRETPEADFETAAKDPRPGGGLGRPIATPDPLTSYRWHILGGLSLLMAMGGFWVYRRPSGISFPVLPKTRTVLVTNDRSAVLLDALKEELFQLEVERQQGKISPEEYATAKAALDQTIQRAVRRIN